MFFTQNKTKKIILNTVYQYILYGIMLFIFLLCVMFAIERNVDFGTSKMLAWIVNGIIYILPIIAAWMYWIGVNKGKVCFSFKNLFIKESVWRLVLRFLVIFCFVLIGIIIDLVTRGTYYNFGGFNILTQSPYYFWVAVFPASYAIFESILTASKTL